MNKSVWIRVKTPVGLTESKCTHETLAQGSGEAGIISSVNLDSGRQDVTLAISDKEVMYGDLPVPYIIYMDDLNNFAEDIEAAKEINQKTENMLESKLLSLNEQKSCYMIIGDRKSRKNLKEDAEKNPLTINGKKMKEVTVIKF